MYCAMVGARVGAPRPVEVRPGEDEDEDKKQQDRQDPPVAPGA
jgi:hypothetical protein